MGSFLNDIALADHNNLVGVANGRQPVSNDDAGLLEVFHKDVKSLLDLMLRLGIKCACGLVQENHLRFAN